MKYLSFKIIIAAVSVVAPASAWTTEAVEEQFRDTLLRLVQEKRIDLQSLPIRFERPAERVANLGLLVDRDDAEGLLILATVPGGSAELLGLMADDRLIEANGLSLRGPGGGERLRDLVQLWENDAVLEFLVNREGLEKRVAGRLEIIELPPLRVEIGIEDSGESAVARSSCARISTFSAAPRSQGLFPVRLLSIEGRGVGSSDSAIDFRRLHVRDQDTFRLEPGRVRLEISELIDRRHFMPVVERIRTRQGAKTHRQLDLEVEPGMTYYLAARLLSDRAEQVIAGEYWEPVVWRVRKQACQ